MMHSNVLSDQSSSQLIFSDLNKELFHIKKDLNVDVKKKFY